MNKPSSTAAHPVSTDACQVVDITSLTANTYKVELAMPVGKSFNYEAGQYIELKLDIHRDGKPHSLFYSIANGFNPELPHRLELFIQNSGGLADKILKRLSQLSDNKEDIKVTMPMGQAFLQTNLKLPHMLIAAGSGISQIKCLTEAILRQAPDANISIYWSNKDIHDFYLLDTFKGWKKKYKNLNFTPILEEPTSIWEGRNGLICEVIKEDYTQLDDVQVYLCGSPQMVYGTIDYLTPSGLQEENCYSDVFEYAPRA